MKPAVNITLALVAGAVVGGVVNSAIVNVGPTLIPLPPGADISTMDGIRESIALFEPANFIPPFLAHAIGTLVGAFVTAKIAKTHRMRYALIIGAFFLAGGIAAAAMIGGPTWFIVADLVLAYLPMAYLGAKLAGVNHPTA